jgi:hypothetical protein
MVVEVEVPFQFVHRCTDMGHFSFWLAHSITAVSTLTPGPNLRFIVTFGEPGKQIAQIGGPRAFMACYCQYRAAEAGGVASILGAHQQ